MHHRLTKRRGIYRLTQHPLRGIRSFAVGVLFVALSHGSVAHAEDGNDVCASGPCYQGRLDRLECDAATWLEQCPDLVPGYSSSTHRLVWRSWRAPGDSTSRSFDVASGEAPSFWRPQAGTYHYALTVLDSSNAVVFPDKGSSKLFSYTMFALRTPVFHYENLTKPGGGSGPDPLRSGDKVRFWVEPTDQDDELVYNWSFGDEFQCLDATECVRFIPEVGWNQVNVSVSRRYAGTARGIIGSLNELVEAGPMFDSEERVVWEGSIRRVPFKLASDGDMVWAASSGVIYGVRVSTESSCDSPSGICARVVAKNESVASPYQFGLDAKDGILAIAAKSQGVHLFRRRDYVSALKEGAEAVVMQRKGPAAGFDFISAADLGCTATDVSFDRCDDQSGSTAVLYALCSNRLIALEVDMRDAPERPIRVLASANVRSAIRLIAANAQVYVGRWCTGLCLSRFQFSECFGLNCQDSAFVLKQEFYAGRRAMPFGLAANEELCNGELGGRLAVNSIHNFTTNGYLDIYKSSLDGELVPDSEFDALSIRPLLWNYYGVAAIDHLLVSKNIAGFRGFGVLEDKTSSSSFSSNVSEDVLYMSADDSRGLVYSLAPDYLLISRR